MSVLSETSESIHNVPSCILTAMDHAADSNLASITYEQVAHRSRLHPSICRRVVQEAMVLLSQHIAGLGSIQVSSLVLRHTVQAMVDLETTSQHCSVLPQDTLLLQSIVTSDLPCNKLYMRLIHDTRWSCQV